MSSLQKRTRTEVKMLPSDNGRGQAVALISKNLYMAYWVSLVSNFVPFGDWRIKLSIYGLNLLTLALLYIKTFDSSRKP